MGDIAKSGGLMTYGVCFPRELRRAAGYVARILDGENPGDLPVQQPTKYNFIINLKTAKALGLTLPPAIMIRATEFIE